MRRKVIWLKLRYSIFFVNRTQSKVGGLHYILIPATKANLPVK